MEFLGNVEMPTNVLEPPTHALESLSEAETNPGQEPATSRFEQFDDAEDGFDDGVETQTAMQIADVMPERRSDPPARRQEPSEPPQRPRQDSVTMIRAEESAPRAIGRITRRPPSPNDNLPTMDAQRPAFMSPPPPPPPPPPPAPPAPPAPAMMQQPSVVTSLPKAPPAIISDGPRAEPELEVGFVEVSNAGAFIDEYRGSVASPMPGPPPGAGQHPSRFSRLQQQSAPPPGTPLQGIPRPRPIATVDALPQAHQWGQRESYRTSPPPRATMSPPPTAGIPHFRTPPQAAPVPRDFRSGIATASQSQSQSLTQSRFKPMAVAWFVVGMAVGMVAMFFIFGRSAAPVEPEPTAGTQPTTSAAAPVQSAPIAPVATAGTQPTSAFGGPQFGPGPAGLPTQPAPVAYPGMPQPGAQQPGMPQPGVQQPGVPQPGVPQPGVPQPGVAPQAYGVAPYGTPQQPGVAPQPPQYQPPPQATFAPAPQPPQYQPQTTPYNALPPAPVAQPAPRPAPQPQYRAPAPAPAPRPRPPPKAESDDSAPAAPSPPSKGVDSAADVLKDAL
jgi:hypothetical protein